MIILHTSLPSYGPGALKPREDPKLFGTENERQLFSPQSGYFVNLGEQCVDNGVGIVMFLFRFLCLGSEGDLGRDYCLG